MMDTEEIIGAMFAAEMGRVPVIQRELIFTTNRIIVAKKGFAKKFLATLAGGFVGLWLVTRSEKKQAHTIGQADVEEVLKADTKNYEILYSETSGAKVKKLNWLLSWPYSVEITVRTENDEHKFRARKVRLGEATDLLRTVLHEKAIVNR
jgi:hypothetical protein